MYIRQTSTLRKSDGSSYQSFRLVESTRVGDKVKQRTLLNLGSDFSVPRELWADLVGRIEEIITHRTPMFSRDATIEADAQQIAAKLLARNREYATEPKPSHEDYQTVDVDSLEHSNLRSTGVEHLMLDALRMLELDSKFDALGFNGAEIAAATGTIIARAAAPGSELATHRWLQQNSALGDLIDYDFNMCSLSRMYRVSDLLLKHRDALEEHLFGRECSLFNLDCTITLFDLTNTYFEGTGQYNDMAQHGRSKEKRSDCPLVTLGIVLDGSGFPRRSKMFPGNASEPATLQQMVGALKESEPDPLIVMDAGIATEDNLTWLKTHGYRYIVVSRKRHLEWDDEQAELVRETGGNKVHIFSKRNDESEEMELYCRSTLRAEKEKAMDELFAGRFEEQMQALADGLHKKGCTKKYDKVMERIGRLKQKYAYAAQHYTVEVEKNDKDLAVSLSFSRTAFETKDHAGIYCLRTNIMDWSASRLWQTYIMLTDLESVFRSMKSELGMRPVYHKTADRTDGHLWITLLAYHLVHTVRLRLKGKGIHDSWGTLRRALRTQMRITTTMRTKAGKVLHIRKASRPDPWQAEIYNALGLTHNPGGTSKTIMDSG